MADGVVTRHVYVVCVTAYRRRVFTDEHLTAMEPVLAAVCADFGAVEGAPLSIIREYVER